MTPEGQRIAIAEVCGAKWWDDIVNDTTIKPGKYLTLDDEGWKRPIPDYLNDLNAMHEAERTGLKDVNDLNRYADELDKVCVPTHICALTHWQSVVMATAAQRAEAFLRAIGKWKD